MKGRKKQPKKKTKINFKSWRERSAPERLADFLTECFGTLGFLLCNGIIFTAWIVINLGMIEGLPVFDPFPFNLLTMVVSLEAIFLAVIVLISQNKAAHIDDIREEIDFRVNVQAEQEITKVLQLLGRIERKLKMKSGRDAELKAMQVDSKIERIVQEVMGERRA